MNKFWTILSHTYLTRVKSKAFIISTIITLLIIVAGVNIQKIIETFSSDDKDEIAVIDQSNQYFSPLKETVERTSSQIVLIDFNDSEEDAKQAVENEEYKALIVLSLNNENLPEATYYANNITNISEQQIIQEQLQQLKIGTAIERAGIDQEILASIYEPVVFHTVALDQNAKTDEELNQARSIVTIMVILMYLVVIVYGTMIINDVATEKSSRVMELLISSAPAVTHLFAKIIGIALLGLTQIGLCIVVIFGLVTFQKGELAGGILDEIGLLEIPISLIGYGILFFLLGYLLYATIAAMLGSLVSRSEDAQQLMMPLIFLIMIGYFIAIFGVAAPESSLVTITSYIPFFSPMLMLLRVGMLEVPIWEVIASIGILLGTIISLGILAARVYRGGVLMYGSSNSLKDIKRAIALSKKE
jgi:ABC-2 type transport system permease protein